jgi:Zn-dependent protease with chaperone function
MMFAARGVVVSLAFFAVVYCTLSVAVALAWWAVSRMRREHTAGSPELLFGMRIFAFAVSSMVTVFFAFPSFWLMERAVLDEDAATFVLAGCALLILGAGLVRVLGAQIRTTRAVRQWLVETAGSHGDLGHPALSAANGAPALILVGIGRPRVMVSDMAAVVLSHDELQVAIRHELGHKRSSDNLKKLLISATPFPGMSKLESAWRDSAELAADDAAVASRQQALDLAAALIKLSRSSSPSQWAEPALASGLISRSSSTKSVSISLRVERLLAWRGGCHYARVWPWALSAMAILIVGISCHYGATLALTHRLTELLVP